MGASAAVYRALDLEHERQVAIKILHQRFTHSEVVRRRFLREQEILREIRHPNVLRIYDDEVSELGEPFIIMELLDGRTLAQIMRRRDDKPMPIPFVLGTMEQVLSVLALCHEKQIVHRDLKPGNIFLTRDHEIKVLDFGVARFHVDGVQLTRDGTALGTPAFMSPEQAMGQLDMLDARSDIFSVGAMMHFLLSGQYLHQGRTPDETFVMAASTPAPSLARRAPELPATLVHMVDKGVAWDREDRWPSATEMLVELRRLDETGNYRDEAPAAAAPPSPATPSLAQAVYQQGGDVARFGPAAAPPAPPQPPARDPNVSSFGAQPARDPNASSFGAQPARPPSFGSEPLPGFGGVSAPAHMSAPDPMLGVGVSAPEPMAGMSAPDPTAGLPGSMRPVWAHSPVFGAQAIQGNISQFGGVNNANAARQTSPTGHHARVHQQLGYIIQEFFGGLEEALALALRHGPQHGELLPQLDRTFAHLQSATQAYGKPLSLRVRPFSLVCVEPPVPWEPEDGVEAIPHALYTAGVRVLRIAPQVERGEFIRFARLLLPPLGRGAPSPEGLIQALWDARLTHIEHQLVTSFQFSNLDEHQAFQSAFDQQVESITNTLKRDVVAAMERRQMLLSMGKDALADAEARRFAAGEAPLAPQLPLPQTLRGHIDRLQRAHAKQAQTWLKRTASVFADALAESFAQRDEDDFLADFTTLTRRYLEEDRASELMALYGTALTRLTEPRQRLKLTRRIFDTATVQRVIDQALRATADDAVLINGFRMLLAELDGEHMSVITRALPRAQHAPMIASSMVHFIRHRLPGHEDALARVLPELPGDATLELMRDLEAHAPHRAGELLRPLTGHRDAPVRLRALERLAAYNALGPADLPALTGLMQHPDANMQQAATLLRQRALPDLDGQLARRLQGQEFHHQPVEERRAAFDMLAQLNPRLAEEIAIGLLHSQHGEVMPALNSTRALAAEILGRLATHDGALVALDAASQHRPWNPMPVQDAAARARHQIMSRRQQLQPGR